MKVNFEDKGYGRIVMTLSHGLQISMDRVEVLMIRDACNEYLENETGSFEFDGTLRSPRKVGSGRTQSD
jgi:hypothetical protein